MTDRDLVLIMKNYTPVASTAHTPGKGPGKGPARTEEEAQAAIKASIIVVHGKVLDKIGFNVAEKANRSAELRLSKTLTTLEGMAVKEHTKYRKERYTMQSQLERLNGTRLQLRREKLKKRLTADDLFAEHKTQTVMELLQPVDPANMVSSIIYKSSDADAEDMSGVTLPIQAAPVSPRGRQDQQRPGARVGLSFRQLREAATDSYLPRDDELSQEEDADAGVHLPDISRTQAPFLRGSIQFREDSTSATSERRGSLLLSPTHGGGPPRPATAPRRQSEVLLSARRPASDHRPVSARHGPPEILQLHRAYTSSEGSSGPEGDMVRGGRDRGMETIEEASAALAARRATWRRNRGYRRVGNEWVPPERADLLQMLREDEKLLQRRIDRFLKSSNPT